MSRLVLGDSLLKQVKYINDCDVYSLSGAKIEELTNFIVKNHSIVSKPASVLIHCGTNNISVDSEDCIISKFERMIEIIRTLNGKAKILISSILARPVDHSKYGLKCAKINKILRDMSKTWNVAFVASHKITLKFGKPKTEMYYDGLHLNAAAVKKFRQFISQRLCEYGTKPSILISGSNYYYRRIHWSSMSD
jgi:lysophospholipase L1-like esterase